MEVVYNIEDWQKIRHSFSSVDLGLVPTMGALHQGHLSLVSHAMRDNKFTIVSIFINPAQFNDPGDLSRYPRNLDKDLEILRAEGTHCVFIPQAEEIYPDNYRYRVTETELTTQLCGMNRPGHFTGVLTVVLKLFNIISPQRAYFGEKDYQQFLLIQGMVKYLFLPVEIIPVPTVRENDGLAMSSRNHLLSSEERILAGRFPEILRESTTAPEAKKRLLACGITVDYVEELYNRRFGAVKIGKVRLIDNVPV